MRTRTRATVTRRYWRAWASCSPLPSGPEERGAKQTVGDVNGMAAHAGRETTKGQASERFRPGLLRESG